ncbi:hypothetical protein QCN27_18235 [Cereibacter sp. SYSU M97828]|nr:hypothetical protein [Cereibacter flavus]
MTPAPIQPAILNTARGIEMSARMLTILFFGLLANVVLRYVMGLVWTGPMTCMRSCCPG